MSGSEIVNIQGAVAAGNVSSTGNVSNVARVAGTQEQRQPQVESGKKLPEETQATEVSTEELTAAVSNISDYVQNVSRDLQFQVDDSTGSTIVTVVDTKTDELIRQIPSEEAVAMSRYISEQAPDPLKGLLVDGKG